MGSETQSNHASPYKSETLSRDVIRGKGSEGWAAKALKMEEGAMSQRLPEARRVNKTDFALEPPGRRTACWTLGFS